MRIFSKILLSLYGGVIFYFLLNLFIGPFGILEYRRLLSIKNELENHVGHLEKINVQLCNDLVAIKENEQELLLRARELGYYKQNEGIIIVQGQESIPYQKSPGYQIKSQMTPLNNNLLLILFSSIFGVSIFFTTFVFGKEKNDYKQKRSGQFVAEQAIPVTESPHYSSM